MKTPVGRRKRLPHWGQRGAGASACQPNLPQRLHHLWWAAGPWEPVLFQLTFNQHRSTSATLHACAMQPRGVNGGSASKISLMDPRHASSEMRGKSFEEFLRARRIFGMHLQPRIDERADQPGPHRALMISGVARTQVAIVLRLIIRLCPATGCAAQRVSAVGAGDLHHGFPVRRIEHRMLQRNRQAADSAGTRDRPPSGPSTTSNRYWIPRTRIAD